MKIIDNLNDCLFSCLKINYMNKKLTSFTLIQRRYRNFIGYPIGDDLIYNIKIIIKMAKQIRALKENSIILCCRGSSGAVIAGIIARELIDLKVKIWHFKKKGESSHNSGYGFSFFNLKQPYLIIVDDFSSTGETLNKINQEIEEQTNYKVNCICLSHINDGAINFRPKTIIAIDRYG